MTRTAPIALAALTALLLAGTAQAADIRAAATVACTATPTPLVYDCAIELRDRRSGTPLDDIDLTVGAHMPSMPMAHNVRPVRARATGQPGGYAASLELEMHGVWALQLDLAGPLRDRVIETIDFQPAAGQAAVPGKGNHGSHGHGHGTRQ